VCGVLWLLHLVLLLLWVNKMETIEIFFCIAALVGGVYIVIDAMIDRGEI
jgi:hypothetical protein